MSQALVKLQRRGQMVIPRSLREEAGISEGTLMKVVVDRGGRLVLTPQVAVDRNGAGGRKNRKQVFQELAVALAELRQDAKDKGLDKMPMSEINRAVAAMRRDMKKEREALKRRPK
jgi:AbrB family looped-hinge helix DNA binding protein